MPISMTGTRLPDERAQAVRSLGSLLNYVRLDPRKGCYEVNTSSVRLHLKLLNEIIGGDFGFL
ncbi:hypothetical protein F2Q69_00047923 [Brassica cretica]|uniref:Uncharacterized protein n=1 Tax=Brassica cretica TaxID=69181 RepID=A0A8S9PMY9_BRACR|nr:hypothetical protein F2Q69_00047923 [Brassica cretica]